MSKLRPFDLADSESFYCGILGCDNGRASDRWTDLEFTSCADPEQLFAT